MSADYCPQCDGDPRRRANVEPHKTHELYPVVQETLAEPLKPDDNQWLED